MRAAGYALDHSVVGASEIVTDRLAGTTMGNSLALVPALAGAGSKSASGPGEPLISPIQCPGPDSSPALTIGSRIRTLRRARGLTQDTLALSTGVSRSAVAQWETGRAGQMGGKLRRIAEALGVSVSMLKEGWEGLATDSVLSAEEMSLLRLFRRCAPEDRTVLMHVAQKLSANLPDGADPAG